MSNILIEYESMGGGINIACGDCLEIEPPPKADLILADPPYGTTHNSWDSRINIAPMWDMIHSSATDKTPVLLFSQVPFAAELIMSNMKEFRYEWVWEKPLATGFLNANRMPMRCHELILVFYKKLPKYFPQKSAVEVLDKAGYREHRVDDGTRCYGKMEGCRPWTEDGTRYPRDVIKFTAVHGYNGKAHSTQKPVDLLEYLINTYTEPGDVVFDFCMGRGSTGIACQNIGRKFYGIEKDEEIFESAKNRLLENMRDNDEMAGKD